MRNCRRYDLDVASSKRADSRGLPYFTQTLSKHAALRAIEERRIEVTNDDVEASMARFIEDSEKSFKEAYRDAIRSNQDNFFEQSLLACALAKTDEEGFFLPMTLSNHIAL